MLRGAWVRAAAWIGNTQTDTDSRRVRRGGAPVTWWQRLLRTSLTMGGDGDGDRDTIRDGKRDGKSEGHGSRETMKVGIADFPAYDGSASPDDFLAQCSRLAGLGGISDASLASIVAGRCTGRALSVINEVEHRLGHLSFTQLSTELKSHFSEQPTAAQAAMQLSRLVKGEKKARDYGQQIRILVRRARPEFFSKEGTVKTICVPAYNAALFRHFLVGLSSEEAALISRLKVTTFDAAVEELVREESLGADTAGAATEDPWSPAPTAGRVRWASPVRLDEDRQRSSGGFGARDSGPQYRRRSSPLRRSTVSPDRRGGASPSARRSTPPSSRRSPSPGRSEPAGGGRRVRAPHGGFRQGTTAAAPPGTGGGEDGRDPPACWSCGGRGHFKRHCPNAWLAGRQ